MNKKYLYISIAILIALAGFVAYKYMDTGWSRYTNTDFGFSLEYPSNQITPNLHPYDPSSVDIDNTDSNKIKSLTLTEPGMGKGIGVSIFPTDPTKVKSFSDFVNLLLVDIKNSPGGDLSFPNLGYATVGGEQAAIEHTIAGGAPPLPGANNQNIELYVFHDQKVYVISIYNLSLTDSERIWKSFKFLK
jgi:hypothetical protein